jgi:hypothetical protein
MTTMNCYSGGMHYFNELPSTIRSKHGYRGCIASITLNGRLIHPINDAAISIARATVEEGCEGEVLLKSPNCPR